MASSKGPKASKSSKASKASKVSKTSKASKESKASQKSKAFEVSKAFKASGSQKEQSQGSTGLSNKVIKSLTYARVVNEDRDDFESRITKNKNELQGNNLHSYLRPDPATSVADSVYENITLYAQDILATLSENGLGGCFSIMDLHEVLTNPYCAYCPRPHPSFGAYVFLPGLVRVCEHCAIKDPRCVGLDEERAKKPKRKNYEDREYGLSEESIKQLPKMTVEIGSWGQVKLLSRPLAQEAMVKQIMSDDPNIRRSSILHVKIRRLETSDGWANARYPAIAPMPYLDLKKNAIVRGRRCWGCKSKYFNTKHYCEEGEEDDQGACEGQDYASRLHWEEHVERWHESFKTCKTKRIMMMEYLPDDFREHFKQCNYARALYNKKARKGTLGKVTKNGLKKEDIRRIDGPVSKDPMYGKRAPNHWDSDIDEEEPDSSEREPETEEEEEPTYLFMDSEVTDSDVNIDDLSSDDLEDWTKPKKNKNKKKKSEDDYWYHH